MKEGEIPFVKAVRFGNFRLWRSRVAYEFMPTRDMLSEEEQALLDRGELKLRKQKETIEAVNVSNLDGSWTVRVPQTFEMFGMLQSAYAWHCSDDDAIRKRGDEFLSTVLANMQWASCVTNGHYHQALFMVATAYANPDLLRDRKQRKAFMKEWEGLADRFLKWRDEYDAFMRRQEKEYDPKDDEMAETAREELEKMDHEGAEG